jgi:hypothetical protein
MRRHMSKRADQRAFNTVYRALCRQKVRSMNREGKCAYRGVKGSKCAIGHLIPDALYRRWLEGKGLHSVIVHVPELHKIDQRLLGDMMSAHDCLMPRIDEGYPHPLLDIWKRNMHRTAELHGLSVPRRI